MKKDKTENEGAAVAPAAGTAVDRPAALDFSADADQGMELAGQGSYAIPFIGLLQSNSPQVETVEGAKAGLFINTITNEIMRECFVIPCHYVQTFIRWAPRSAGGGYRGEYRPIDVELGKIEGLKSVDGQLTIEDDILRDTRNHYVLVQAANGTWTPAVMSMASTQVKRSKRWMSRIRGIELRTSAGKAYTPPSFAHIYKCTSVKETNDKGSWYSWEIELVKPVDDTELYQKAKVFHDDAMKGAVKVAPPEQESDADGTGPTGGKF